MWKRIFTPVALATPQLLCAAPLSLTARLDNYCSAGAEQTRFYCGMEPQESNFEDLDRNGIFDIYEPGRSFTLTLALPEAPAGYEYVASSNGTLRLEAFGDLDSDPMPPENPAELQADGYYDHEWMDVSLGDISLGRIFDGNLDNDRFNIGVEQNWWPHSYDRGTLWGAAGPETIFGEAEILQSELTAAIQDGEITVEFGLARSHNDLTGHPYFDDREEFIELTLDFEAELIQKSQQEAANTPTQIPAEEAQSRESVLSETNTRQTTEPTQGGGSLNLLLAAALAGLGLRNHGSNKAPRRLHPNSGSRI